MLVVLSTFTELLHFYTASIVFQFYKLNFKNKWIHLNSCGLFLQTKSSRNFKNWKCQQLLSLFLITSSYISCSVALVRGWFSWCCFSWVMQYMKYNLVHPTPPFWNLIFYFVPFLWQWAQAQRALHATISKKLEKLKINEKVLKNKVILKLKLK